MSLSRILLVALCPLFIYCRYRGRVIGNRYGAGNGTILLDNVQCLGNETAISECPHGGWNYHDCGHNEDVSVSCGTSPVQYGNFNCSDINHFQLPVWILEHRILRLHAARLVRVTLEFYTL